MYLLCVIIFLVDVNIHLFAVQNVAKYYIFAIYEI